MSINYFDTKPDGVEVVSESKLLEDFSSMLIDSGWKIENSYLKSVADVDKLMQWADNGAEPFLITADDYMQFLKSVLDKHFPDNIRGNEMSFGWGFSMVSVNN